MFERFTEKGIKVIMHAQEEARRLKHNFVGSEQLLLGMIHDHKTIAGSVLRAKNIHLKKARIEVEKIIGRGSGFVTVEIPFTPRAKRIVELAWTHATQLGHNYISTEHLLLALIQIGQLGEGVAARVIENMGVNLSDLKQAILRHPDLNAGTPIQIESTYQHEPTSTIESKFEAPVEDPDQNAGPSIPPAQARECPVCGEQIYAKAILCRYCQSGLSEEHFRFCPHCGESIRKQAKLCRLCNSNVESGT